MEISLIRVAFTFIGGKHWMGGYNYLRNLITVLDQYQSNSISPVLFCGDDISAEELMPFKQINGLKIYQHHAFNRDNKYRSLLKAILLGRDPSVNRIFDTAKIDVVFEVAHFYGWYMGRPALAWIADFQHRLLPRLFSWQAKFTRELGFRCQIASKRQIMLSSEDSRASCQKFYPKTVGRTSVVRFAIELEDRRNQEECIAIAHGYGLPEHFFYMPNQFWSHKNHHLVIDALNILREKGIHDVVIVASGAEIDSRNPDHFNQLLEKIDRLQVKNQFYLLGMIPYSHISALMRTSKALLNPSLFEGWSTTVEEAKAIGVPLLLSDLDVHKEQAGNNAVYFDRYNAQSLANALILFPRYSNQDREVMEKEAIIATNMRVELFAKEFVIAIKESMTHTQ